MPGASPGRGAVDQSTTSSQTQEKLPWPISPGRFPRITSQVLLWREDIITTQGGNTGHRSCRRWRNTEFTQWTNWWATENFELWSNDSTRFQSFGFWIHETSQEPAVLSGSFWIKVQNPGLQGLAIQKHIIHLNEICFSSSTRGDSKARNLPVLGE